jgi:hypothetical protein
MQKNVACKEQDGEIVRQDKIARIIFVLQVIHFIAAHQVLFHVGDFFLNNLNRLHAKDHVLYIPQEVHYI